MSLPPRFIPPLPAEVPYPGLYLLPLDDSFYPPKRIALRPGQRVRIGRQLNNKTTPGDSNGVFESRVLSRSHAEAWVENDKIFIKDVKSSNGTFVNGERLSLEGLESEPFELHTNDIVEFGIDILGEHGEVAHRKVSCRVTCALTAPEAQAAVRSEQRQYPSASSPASNGPPPVPPLPPGAPFQQQPPPLPSPRRPQQATGLAGMGGMGSERIRSSSISFDSILARLHAPPLISPPLPPPPASVALPAVPVSSAPAIPSTEVPDAQKIAQLAADLERTRTTLQSLPSFASSFSSSPISSSSFSLPTSISHAPESGDSADYPLHKNTRLLRDALADLRAEVADLQARRDEALQRTRQQERRRRQDAKLERQRRKQQQHEEWVDDVDFRAESLGLSSAQVQGEKRALRDVFTDDDEAETLLGGEKEAPQSFVEDASPFRVRTGAADEDRRVRDEDEELEQQLRTAVQAYAPNGPALNVEVVELAATLDTLEERVARLQTHLLELSAEMEDTKQTRYALAGHIDALEGRVGDMSPIQRESVNTLLAVPDSPPAPLSSSSGQQAEAGGEAARLKTALQEGLEALRADWAAFRAETTNAYVVEIPAAGPPRDYPTALQHYSGARGHHDEGHGLDSSPPLYPMPGGITLRLNGSEGEGWSGWGLVTPEGSVRESGSPYVKASTGDEPNATRKQVPFEGAHSVVAEEVSRKGSGGKGSQTITTSDSPDARGVLLTGAGVGLGVLLAAVAIWRGGGST